MIAWEKVYTVLLDMDGTLLDLHYDNHFWLEHVPRRYAEKNALTLEAAKSELMARYKKAEGTLDWYCVDYWTRELGLDIPQLKEEVDHLIAVHPHVLDFLHAVRAAGRRLVLVTNAHGKAIEIKFRRTRLGHHFDAVVCSHDLGIPKENVDFWKKMQRVQPFAKEAALLVDDSLPVLRAARATASRTCWRCAARIRECRRRTSRNSRPSATSARSCRSRRAAADVGVRHPRHERAGVRRAPSCGAQEAKSFSPVGRYGPRLTSNSTVPGASDTSECQAPAGTSTATTGPPA